MNKATEDKEDPFLALLAWRNTPSEQLGPSPVQIMFGRRTRTHLPSPAELMTSAHDAQAHDALVAAKARQASYYNHGARERPPLAVGDTVRTRWKDGEEWKKGQITAVLPHRSYIVKDEDGTTRRRTSKHVRFSREPPLVYRDEVDCPSRDKPGGLPTATTSNNSAPAAGTTNNRSQQLPPATEPPVVTRSGRRVRQHVKYKDYVC